jgi:ribosomal protein L37E
MEYDLSVKSGEMLRATLYGLVRKLYAPAQADEIIESFDLSLTLQPDEDARRELLEYWIDFYRLQEYRLSRRRRRQTLEERTQSCRACGYPASQRHHLWALNRHGENEVTLPLCANCHELLHGMYHALLRPSKSAQRRRKTSQRALLFVRHVLGSEKISAETAQRLLEWCRATLAYEAENGWIEPGADDEQWIEKRLGWSELMRGKAEKV